MNRKTWNAEDVKAIMLKHYPRETPGQYGMSYSYCKCGEFLDFESAYPKHVDELLKKTRGSK